MKIGESIRRLRRERGLTQEELALELDTAASTVSRIENDERTPSLDMLVRLAASLQVSVGELFTSADLQASPPSLAENDLALHQYGQNATAAGEDYMELRRCYRALSPENQRLALALIKALARHQHKP